MTEQTQLETFTLDDTEYKIEDLNDEGKYYLGQLRDLQLQGERLRGSLHQVEIAAEGFTDLLRKELKSEEK